MIFTKGVLISKKQKTFFLFFILFFLTFAPIFSSDFSLEIVPSIGISYGQFDERIYSSTNSSIKRSLLEWEIKPIFSFGLSVKLGWKNLFLETQGDFSIPYTYGTLKDSDWNEKGDVKCIYSLLDEKLENSFNVQSLLHYDFITSDDVLFSPTIIAEYSYLKIKGTNGEGWFASAPYTSTGKDEAWNSGYARYFSKGRLNGINYERYAVNFFSGFKIGAKFTKKIFIDIGIFISPFSSIQIYDTHLNGNSSPYELNQYVTGYFSIYKIVLHSQYDLSKKIALDFTMDFSLSDILKSPLYHNYYSAKTVKSNQDAGTNYYMLTIKFGAKIKIF